MRSGAVPTAAWRHGLWAAQRGTDPREGMVLDERGRPDRWRQQTREDSIKGAASSALSR